MGYYTAGYSNRHISTHASCGTYIFPTDQPLANSVGIAFFALYSVLSLGDTLTSVWLWRLV